MGQLVRGVLLVNATRTTSGAGTAYQVGAVGEGQSLVATLHVTAASPADTLTVNIESDALEAFGSATNRITFDPMTAIGSQQKSINGPITDIWYRENRAIVGTAESFTYVVTVGVDYAESAAIPPPPAESILDAFNRADSAVTLGTTDTAETWLYLGTGTFGIDTNRAYHIGASRGFAYVVSPWSDGTLSIDIVVLANCGIAFRVVDVDNLFMAVADVGTYKLYRKQAGSFVEIGAGGVSASSDVLSVVLAGSSITVKKNGSTVIGPVTDAFQQTAVGHGLTDGDTIGRYDNFSIVP